MSLIYAHYHHMYVNSFIKKGPHTCAVNGSNCSSLVGYFHSRFWNQILYSGQPLPYKYVQNGFHSLLWQVIPNFKLKVQDEWTVLQPDQRMGWGADLGAIFSAG